jgi:hypothetical protein
MIQVHFHLTSIQRFLRCEPRDQCCLSTHFGGPDAPDRVLDYPWVTQSHPISHSFTRFHSSLADPAMETGGPAAIENA